MDTSKTLLYTTKVALGIPEANTAFDEEILMNISTALFSLSQLSVVLRTLQVNGDTTWNEILNGDVDSLYYEVMVQYVYLKTRLGFDPPTNSFLVDAINKQIEELGWRLTVATDVKEDELYD